MEEGRLIEKFVFDFEATKGMTKEERRAYYVKLFLDAEEARLEAKRLEAKRV